MKRTYLLKRNIFLLLLLSTIHSHAQVKHAIYVQNTDLSNKVVSIKWYHNNLLSTEGANIYRHEKDNGQWIKINNEPIKYGKKIPEKDLLQDKSLNEYITLSKKMTSGQQNNITLLGILLKSIESAPYARYLGIQYDDVNLVSGKSYEYKIMLIKNGNETELGISPVITAGRKDTLYPPQNIEIKPLDKKVAFKWRPDPAKFFSVNIYRNNPASGQLTKINNTPILISSSKNEKGEEIYPENFYTDNQLKNEQVYEYILKAVDYFGQESMASEILKVTPGSEVPPPAPSNLKVKVGKLYAQLNWSPPQNTKDVTGFNIYRSKSDKATYLKITETPLNIDVIEYADNLQKSGGYYYYVTSVNKRGLENKSNKVFADVKDVIPPSKPTNLIIKADTGRIILKWNANTDNDLMGYWIYRKIDDKKMKEYVPIVSKPVKNSYFIDTIPKNVKNSFLYQIAAIDSSLNISERADATAVQMPDVIPPIRPFIKKVSQIENTLTIEWIPNHDADLIGYDVFRSLKKDSVIRTEKMNTKTIDREITRFVDRWAEPGIKYFYHIVAIDSAGNRSSPSEVYSGIIKAQSANQITLKEFKADYYKKKKHVILKCVVEQKENYKGTVIYKGITSDNLKPLTGLSTDEESIDKEISMGNTYYYQAKIFDTAGNTVKSEVVEVIIK